MRIRLALIIGLVVFLSCNQNGDIFQTKTGAYASKSGQFEAKFPTVPLLDIQDEKDGDYDFKVYTYKSILDATEIFSVDYRDFPNERIKNVNDEDFLGNIAINYMSTLPKYLDFDDLQVIDNKGSKGIYLTFKPKESSDVKPMVHLKIIKKENRIYYISYVGLYNDRVDSFMKSFKITN